MKKEKLLPAKLAYTIGILLVYMLGKHIPVYGADLTQYIRPLDTQDFLMQSISGDLRKVSVLALGISPYMIASLIVMLVTTIRRAASNSKISIKKINQVTMTLTLLLSMVQSALFVRGMIFTVDKAGSIIVMLTAFLELTSGALLICWLCQQNKEKGLAGQSALIFLNILEGIMAMLSEEPFAEAIIPMLIGFATMAVMLVLEMAEFRIPVQRISIYSIYADKNYLAFKLNPIGVMPVMFAMAMFNLLQILAMGANYLLGGIPCLDHFLDNLSLTTSFGIKVYIIIIYALNLFFSLLMLGPRDIAEQFQQSGDSVCNLCAGWETQRYLFCVVLLISLFSSTVMSLCVGIPLHMALSGQVSPALMMLPSSMMMLAGIGGTISAEIQTVHSFDSYKTFF